MEESVDFVFTSGRENLDMRTRGVFLLESARSLASKEVNSSFLDRVRKAALYALWELKEWAPAISKVECEVMAWARGGELEWKQTLHEQTKPQ